MKNYKIIICLSLMLFNFSGTGFGKKAYIFIGNIDQAWYSDLIRSTTGEVDHWKELDPLLTEQIQELKNRGFEIIPSKVSMYEGAAHIGIPSTLKRALLDPETKAVVWFGHGDKETSGQLYTFLHNTAGAEVTITPQQIKEWAKEKLRKELGSPEQWKNLSNTERQRRLGLINNARFNLEYAYFHVCYGMRDNSLPNSLMSENGDFYGYNGLARLKNTSEKWINSPLIRSLQKNKYLFGWSGGEANDHDDSRASYYRITSVSVFENQIKIVYAWKEGVMKGEVKGNTLSARYWQTNGNGRVQLTFTDDHSRATGWWVDDRDTKKRAAFMKKTAAR